MYTSGSCQAHLRPSATPILRVHPAAPASPGAPAEVPAGSHFLPSAPCLKVLTAAPSAWNGGSAAQVSLKHHFLRDGPSKRRPPEGCAPSVPPASPSMRQRKELCSILQCLLFCPCPPVLNRTQAPVQIGSGAPQVYPSAQSSVSLRALLHQG